MLHRRNNSGFSCRGVCLITVAAVAAWIWQSYEQYVALQVRQQIYSSAVGKWKTYEKELKDVQKSLAHLIEEYEAEAGLSDAHDEL